MHNKNRIIKICFVLPYCYALFNTNTNYNFGGSEVRASLFGKELAKIKEFEVSFAVFDHGQARIEKYGNVSIYADKFFGRQYNDEKKVKRLPIISRLLKLIKKVKSLLPRKHIKIGSHSIPLKRFNTYLKIDADVYCTFGVSNHSAYLTSFCNYYKKKHLLFLGSGSDLDEAYKTLSNGRNVYGSLYDLCHFTLLKSHLVITQNKEQQALFEKRFDRNSVLIKNPIDLKSTIPRNSNPFLFRRVLWIGKSDIIKQPELLLELAKVNKKLDFVMIMNKSNKKIHDKVLANLPGNVKVVEFVKFEEVESYFAESSLFINTSKFEGFANTFLQACKYGLPIFSLNSNPDDFITEYKCGFWSNGDLNSLSISLEKLFNDKELYQEYRNNAFRYVQKNHDIDQKVELLSGTINASMDGGFSQNNLI